MSVSLAELDSRCFLSLAPAAEWLDLSTMHNAVVQRLNIRTMKSRASTVHVLLATTDEFAVTTLDMDITALIGKATPCFVEQRWVQQDQIDSWQNIRVVPFSQLNDYQAMGAFACAFHGEEPNDDPEQATQYLRFTFIPGGTCRIRFDRDNQRTALEADILLPDNLSELVVKEAQNDVIPTIQLAIEMGLRRDEDGRKDSAGIIAALGGVFTRNESIIKDLDALWRMWAFEDRSRDDGKNLPTPNASNLYPGGTNANGGWGGGWGGGY